jgi:hypothetical protein
VEAFQRNFGFCAPRKNQEGTFSPPKGRNRQGFREKVHVLSLDGIAVGWYNLHMGLRE